MSDQVEADRVSGTETDGAGEEPQQAGAPDGAGPERPAARLARLTDTPLLPGAIGLLAGAVLVIARWARVGQHSIGSFIVAGTQFVHGPNVPAGVPVRTPVGYDGQFYYRMALAPLDFSHVAHGITIDVAFRYQRIGYPAAAWLLALGHARWVPDTLVLVNVLSLGLLAYFGACWARSYGRHALWGLVPAGFFGMEFTIARDLTELLAAALVVGAVVAVRRERHVLAALALSGAVLCRETALIFAAAIFISRIVDRVRRETRTGRADLVWFLPASVFVLWQVVVRLIVGVFPLRSDQGSNLAWPFVGLWHDLSQLGQATGKARVVDVTSLVVLGVVVVLAIVSMRRSSASRPERIAFVLALGLMLCLSTNVWNPDPTELRTFVDTWIFAGGILLGTRGRWLLAPGVLALVAWVVAAAWNVTQL